MFSYISIYALYGIPTLGSLFFFWLSFDFYIQYFWHESESEAEIEDYDVDNPFEEDGDAFFDELLSESFYRRLLDLDLSFSGLLNFFLIVCLAGFFGVSFFIFSYFFLVLLLYIYLSLNKGFVGKGMVSVTQLDSSDPSPGLSYDEENVLNNTTPFCDLDNMTLLSSGRHSMLSSRFGLFNSIETLLHEDCVNPIFIKGYRDPYFFSKFNYYYLQFYIFSAINEFWRSFPNPAIAPWRPEFPSTNNYFYPTSPKFFPFRAFMDDVYPGSPFVFSSREAVLKRVAQREYMTSFSALFLKDPAAQFDICVGDFDYALPIYRARPNVLNLLYFTISRFIVDLTPLFVASFSSKGPSPVSFTQNIINSIEPAFFRSFPSSYFYRWAALFFSYRLGYVPFKFKDSLLPDSWNLLSLSKPVVLGSLSPFLRNLFSVCSSVPARRIAGFVFEFLSSSSVYPTAAGSGSPKYYFVKGYLFRYTSESLRLFNFFQNMPLFQELHQWFLARRFRKDRFVPGLYSSLEKANYDTFALKKWIGTTGDGLEPFFSPSANFGVDCLPSLRNNIISQTLEKRSDDLHFEYFVKRFVVVNKSSIDDRLVLLSTFDDPRWLFINQLALSFKPLRVYLRNLVYNPQSSDFYSSFLSEYGSDPFFGLYRASFLTFSRVLPLKVELTPLINGSATGRLGFYTVVRSTTVFPKLLGSPSLGAFKAFRSLFKSSPVRLMKNRFRRDKLSRKSTILSSGLRLNSSVGSGWRLKSRLSVWGYLNLFLYDSELLSTVSRRSFLKMIVRDPFALFTHSSDRYSGAARFRRFFWESAFSNAARSAIFSAISGKGSNRLSFARYLHSELSGWFQSKFSFSDNFLIFLISDINLYGEYFMLKTNQSRSLSVWSSLSADFFSVNTWKYFLLTVLAEPAFINFLTNKVQAGFRFSSLFLPRLRVDLDLALKTLFKVRNDLILNLPNRALAKLATKSAINREGFYKRKDWKVLVGTVSSLVYSLFTNLLVGTPMTVRFESAFLSLLQSYSDSNRDYLYYTQFLFPTLNPLFKEYSYKTNRHEDEENDPIDCIERFGDSIDWWQTKPAESLLEPIADILGKVAGNFPPGYPLPKYNFEVSFINFLSGRWTLSSKLSYFSSFSYSLTAPTLLFMNSHTRFSFLNSLPHSTAFFLDSFYREYRSVTQFSSGFVSSELASFSFYEECFPMIGDEEDAISNLTSIPEDFFDLDFDDTEELVEDEEEGSPDDIPEEDEEDPERELVNSSLSTEGFDEMFGNDPLVMPFIGWKSVPGQAQPEYFHERLGFGSFEELPYKITDPFLVRCIPTPYFLFAFYCLFKGLALYIRDPEYVQDFLTDSLFRESVEDIRKAKFIGFVD